VIRLRDRIEWLLAEDLPEDDHGNATADWASARVITEPAFISPQVTTENLSAQDTVSTVQLAFLLPTTVGTARSRVRWRGLEYEVVGDVLPITDQRAKVHHCEATLRRTF
jgi:hypothetical protein